MIAKNLQETLEKLKSERDRLDAAIAAIEGLISGEGATVKRRGRPPKAEASAAGAKTRRKNAPRGLLKQRIHQILKAAKKPMKPVVLRDAVMKAGYPLKNKVTLYTSIFNAAKADPKIKKTAAGFSMK